ncbi:MAG: KH domain-containing protein [Clostridia bacterium]|jgi:predicted RNA-binding protein YlqC (UPF0109 family)|nr:KH domain-containing protein [Clostridia bacterium]
MKELVIFMAKSLVSNPDDVRVEEVASENMITYKLSVNKEDMGKVIGKQGKIAHALRTILKSAATKTETKVMLEIVD